MNLLILWSFILSIVLGIGRGADLALGIDPVSGLCMVGSVWWRYLALGAVVLLAVLAGRTAAKSTEPLRHRQPVAGVLAFGTAILFLAGGAAQFLAGASGIGMAVRVVLEVLCAVWMSVLGRSWLRPEEGKGPLGSLLLAVPGSALFYWNVLMRFMENSSSWHRVTPTAAVWQVLAALVFLAALARALYLPEPDNAKTLCASGLAAFSLCLCWELPQLLVTAVQSGVQWAEVLPGAALCCIGALGGVCAARCAEGQK